MYGVLLQIEAYLSLKKCMVTPNFLFGYQEHLLSSALSELFWTAQKYSCIDKHRRLEIRVSWDAQNVCAITIVGTVLKVTQLPTHNPKLEWKHKKNMNKGGSF